MIGRAKRIGGRVWGLLPWRPRGAGYVSPRAWVSGFGKNITVARGASVAPRAWLVCKTRSAHITIGEGTSINSYAKIHTQRDGQITIGKHCSLHSFCVIYGEGDVVIGDHVRIATHTVIVPNNHAFNDMSKNIYEQGSVTGKITIGNDVWIGAGVTILTGVTVGSHSVIAAGAVVIKDVPENAVVGGIPAKVLKHRNTTTHSAREQQKQ